jgi:ribosomal protein S12 methylthiotransferase
VKTKIPQINIVTLGCSKNNVDSEVIAGQLNRMNIQTEHGFNNGNIVIINTCGFINDAKEESIDTILLYKDLKKRKKIDKLYVMGCLIERYKDDLSNEIKGIDGWYGVNDMAKIIADLGAEYRTSLIGERTLSNPPHYAYLKISEGCDRSCSFCAIPLIRGKHISRTMESLVEEVETLAKSGVKELILIAQDLTMYGVDLYKKRALAELLDKLAIINGIKWIRLHYAYPANFPMDVIEVMKKHANICKYIDIPFQHINDVLLDSMQRSHTQESTYKLIETLRNEIPEIAIRTTLIVGYPGETDAQFTELKEFVQNCKFERLGVFTYSEEENTPAAELDDDVSSIVKEQRLSEIMELQQDISLAINESKIGKIYNVIIDREEDGFYYGRTEFDSPDVDNEVIINSEKELIIGEFYPVKIESANFFDLEGILVESL